MTDYLKDGSIKVTAQGDYTCENCNTEIDQGDTLYIRQFLDFYCTTCYEQERVVKEL